MTIRTEGDIVLASNLSCELSMLIANFLKIYRLHANGVNGVFVPKRFTVVLQQVTKSSDDQMKV